MADTEYSVGLKDQVSPGLEKIKKNLEKLQSKFKEFSRRKTFEENVESANKFGKGLKFLGPVVGQLAGKLGMFGDGLEAITDNLMEGEGKAAIFGKRLLITVAVLAAIAAAFYGVAKAALFADEKTAQVQRTNMKIAGDLGPKYADMTKQVIASSMQLSQQLGKPYAEIASTISEALNAGMNINQAKRYAQLSTALEASGKSGKEFLDLMKQIQTLEPGKGIDSLVSKSLSPDKQQEQINKLQETLNLFGGLSFDELAKIKDPAEIMNKLMNAQGSDQLIKNAEDSVSSTTKLSMAWDNMIAKVFSSEGGKTAIQPLIDMLNDPETVKSVRSFFESVVTLFNWIIANGKLVATIIGVLAAAMFIWAIATNAMFLPILLIVAGIALLVAAVIWLYDIISENWDSIVQFFSNMWNTMKDIGGNIVRGLWDGINNMAAWLMNNISTFATNIINKVKEIFGIHSPSREFAIIGKYNVEGLEKGMNDTLEKGVDFNADAVTGKYELNGSQQQSSTNNTANMTFNISTNNPEEVKSAIINMFNQLNFNLG